jgi:hypothetical protein
MLLHGPNLRGDNTCVTYPGQANQFNKAARLTRNFWRYNAAGDFLLLAAAEALSF